MHPTSRNRVPHKQLDGSTPFKSWSGHKPDVTHFRIFGSKDWARIPTEKEEGFSTPKTRVPICWVLLSLNRVKYDQN